MVDFEEVENAIDISKAADEVERLLALYKSPALRVQAIERAIIALFPANTDLSVILRAEKSINTEVFRRMGERAAKNAPRRVHFGVNRHGQQTIIGQISRGSLQARAERISGKDAAAGKEVEDRNDAYSEAV